MAALINLHLIQRLEPEALLLGHSVECSCLNWNRTSDVEGEEFVTNAKIYQQAKNLDIQLTDLFEVCTLFAQGSFEKHPVNAGKKRQKFDPFAKLNSFFADSSHSRPDLDFLFNPYILPPKIEQYAELVQMVHGFSESQKRWRQINDMEDIEDGEIGSDEDLELELYDIEIDHCLDGYNEFYERTRQLINSYQIIGDVQGCATEILRFFQTSQPGQK